MGKPLKANITSCTDEELLKLIHSEPGNNYAGELYKRYAHLVFSICFKYLKNKSDSNDVMMNVFERFLKKPPSGDIFSFKKWLLTVSKNESLTFLRNSKRASTHLEEWKKNEKKSGIFVENEDVWSLNNKANDENHLRKAMEVLKAPQRMCLELFYIKGRSYKEIEAQTDFTLKEVKSHLQNGKRKLRLLLEDTKPE